ncbi:MULTISPECIES: LysR family transcriptional regulator [Pseudomonas]|uniref:LysR family transcriptional regulator n=1 Tax=Pseudomonas synxantha TaxID=47883 RepID=A0A5D3GDL7_9PSED|nr:MULTISPECIES: LysR family transcriptional regulator [Pseudomonas]MBY8971638.1 LysR family transcriptional regulator [Pseudomonas sp. P867]MCK3827576.1 LysR family transcriptional regulator [Pseudomonas sp. W2Aug9]MCK3832590.1 LysR family transcriptional regulator [Pseudomonas fluorescens]TYK57848.1 LysR family transcriptional regulator [Pseudomonas synxantha]UEH10993.1 LysR family transcriptional regulator [Pseudomonas sp. HN8-3]
MDYFSALTAFVEAAEGNNFSRAAERLGIKASTVSRYIKDLEQDLGIALFNRSTRTLHLTEGGQTFLMHARRVLDELEHAKAATSALNQQPRGLLKLNLPPAFARHHILPALKDFCARYPQISVELVLDNAQVNLIHAGVDLAIRIGALADSTLKARKLCDGHYRVVVSPAFARQHPAPSTPADLAGLPAVLGTLPTGAISFDCGDQVSPLLHNGCIRINDLDAQLIAARQGLGFALLPDWLVAQSIQAGELLVWLPQWQIRDVERDFAVWFVYPPKRIVSSKVRCFIDFIVERLGETPEWT